MASIPTFLVYEMAWFIAQRCHYDNNNQIVLKKEIDFFRA